MDSNGTIVRHCPLAPSARTNTLTNDSNFTDSPPDTGNSASVNLVHEIEIGGIERRFNGLLHIQGGCIVAKKRSGIAIEVQLEASCQGLTSVGIDHNSLDPVCNRSCRFDRLEVDSHRCRSGTVDIVAES